MSSLSVQRAAYYGLARPVKVLLDHGASTSLTNREGLTAEEIAREAGHVTITHIIAAEVGRGLQTTHHLHSTNGVPCSLTTRWFHTRFRLNPGDETSNTFENARVTGSRSAGIDR